MENRARNWMGVLNNPTLSAEEFIKELYQNGKINYICGQLEKGTEGTLHIQYFVQFST